MELLGYIAVISFIVLIIYVRFRGAKQAGESTQGSSSSPPHKVNVNFEHFESFFFWVIVPIVFGAVFFTCVFTPIKGCQDKLTQESNEATQKIREREREGQRRYQEYQRRAYPQKCKNCSSSRRSRRQVQKTKRTPQDPFWNLTVAAR